jgi:pyroglutamyl-peptidase
MVSDTVKQPIRILITGFGPFGNVVCNPSVRIARQFKRQAICGASIVTRAFRVSYDEVDRDLRRILAQGAFDIVLLLGIAGNERGIRLERFGKNKDSASAPDVDRKTRRRRPIIRNGQQQFETAAPFSAIRELLKRNGARCRISEDAGGFLCNHAYYVAQNTIARHGMKSICLFVHVPPDRFAIKGMKAKQTMPVLKQIRAVKLIAQHICTIVNSTAN